MLKRNKKPVRLFPVISTLLVGMLLAIVIGQTAAFAAKTGELIFRS